MNYTLPASNQVTVIALCFNHARFLQECLNSIACQTFQDFQLIVMDDSSNDNSVELIESWLSTYRPNATFIRHTTNVGICKTLNEALLLSRGEFISMIATDDVWEADKIERQLKLIEGENQNLAVIYSDASRMDEAGNRLTPDFIEAHAPECIRPSGNVFAELANRNFIPAMATLIRRQALLDVGKYDERLTFEDYDMWLRLADRYDFRHDESVLARYRVVSNSLVRTVLFHPTAKHYYTQFLICQKWLPSKRLNQAQFKSWSDRLWSAAYGLYCLDDDRAKSCLWQAVRYSRRPRALLLALACSVGISRKVAKRWGGAS